MPLPIPNLDDRRFNELVAEARARIASHTPEWSPMAPGDPGAAFSDLFAWLTETILYRANLIPERQRRAFLTLLDIPLRPAEPARGIVSVDLRGREPSLTAAIAAGTTLRAGPVSFVTESDLQPTWLSLSAAIKERIGAEELREAGVNLADLRALYGRRVQPFRPRQVLADGRPIGLAQAQDNALYLALVKPKTLETPAEALRETLVSKTLSIALSPPDAEEADPDAEAFRPRLLRWDVAVAGEDGQVRYLPLELVEDSSRGLRETGVARLRLPRRAGSMTPPLQDDPQNAGAGNAPPELPADIAPERLVLWLRMTCEEQPDLRIGHVAVNGVKVVARSRLRNKTLGVGTGQPLQSFALGGSPVDPASLRIEVAEQGRWNVWRRVEHLVGQEPDDPVYTLDAAAGSVRFGDGLRGKRVPRGARVRAAELAFGGGAAGNLPPGKIKEITAAGLPLDRLKVRQDWPTRGGRDGETVAEAEQRIPAFLAHRNRAVTAEDFDQLAREVPGQPVGRVEVVPGLVPGASREAIRENVPGVVAVFALPPAEQRGLDAIEKPRLGFLRDLYDYLAARRLIGTELYVLSPEFLPLGVSVTLDLVDPANQATVLKAAEQAVIDYLWPLAPGGPAGGGWPLGRAVRPAEIETQVARVEGVLAVNAVALYTPDEGGDWTPLPGGAPLPLTTYQLPELIGVLAAAGRGTPEAPRGLTPEAGGGGAWPVPVVPDIC